MCRAGGCASGLERGDGRWWLSQWAPGLLDNAFRLSTEHALHGQRTAFLLTNKDITVFSRTGI